MVYIHRSVDPRRAPRNVRAVKRTATLRKACNGFKARHHIWHLVSGRQRDGGSLVHLPHGAQKEREAAMQGGFSHAMVFCDSKEVAGGREASQARPNDLLNVQHLTVAGARAEQPELGRLQGRAQLEEALALDTVVAAELGLRPAEHALLPRFVATLQGAHTSSRAAAVAEDVSARAENPSDTCASVRAPTGPSEQEKQHHKLLPPQRRSARAGYQDEKHEKRRPVHDCGTKHACCRPQRRPPSRAPALTRACWRNAPRQLPRVRSVGGN